MPTPGNIWLHNKLQNKLVYGQLGNWSYFQYGSQTYEQENCQQQTMGRGLYCSHTLVKYSTVYITITKKKPLFTGL